MRRRSSRAFATSRSMSRSKSPAAIPACASVGSVDHGGGQAGAKERIAAADVVIEEAQRPVAGEGLDPERHLGELDGGRVVVHAVETPLDDTTLGPGIAFALPLGADLCGEVAARVEHAGGAPRNSRR